MQVYLAGPMPGPDFEGGSWREYATLALNEFGIDTESPTFQEDYADEYLVSLDEAAKILTYRDRKFSTTSDVVLFNFVDAKKASIGSCIELGWASHAGVIIAAVMPVGNIHVHPMVETCVDFRCSTLPGALSVVTAYLVGTRLNDDGC